MVPLQPVIRTDDDDDYPMTPWVGLGNSAAERSAPAPAVVETQKQQSAVDATAEDLYPRLTAQNVVDLVLLSMVSRSRSRSGSSVVRSYTFLLMEAC